METQTAQIDRVPRCCSESGRRILWAFCPPPVTWCHCDLWCTRCVPYGQLGSEEEKRISLTSHQIVSSSQVKHCCLPLTLSQRKTNSKFVLYLFWSGRQKREAPFTRNRESFFLDRAMPTTAFLFLFAFYPLFLQSKRLIIALQKSSAKSIFNSGQLSALFAVSPAETWL